MKTALSINLNKVALLRNQRHVPYPSVVGAAETVIANGAHGITVHPRPDERHIRKSDVYDIAAFLTKGEHKDNGVEFNIEGNPFPDFMTLIQETRPDQATLVPDAPDANTSDTGWDVRQDYDRLKSIVSEIKAMDIRVSLFMNPDPDAMPIVRDLGADRIELYTGPYADAFESGSYSESLEAYAKTAKAAVANGLGINAGHDLTTANLPAFKKAIPALAEVSIGHAFVADSLWMGFAGATQAFLRALD